MEPGFLLLALASALLPDARASRAAALATASVGLAAAGLRAGPPPPATPGFEAVAAALLALAEALAVAAGMAALRGRRTAATPAGLAALVGGGLGLAWSGAGLLAAGSAAGVLLALLAVAGIGGFLLVAGWLVRLRPADRERLSAEPRAAVVGLFCGTVAAAAAPDAGLVFLSTIAAAVSAYLLCRSTESPRLPIAPALTLGLLPAWWLMATVAGSVSLPLRALPSVPFSPAAERLLAPPLLLAAWAMAGLWPLHRQLPGVLTAPAGALLMARVAMPAVPDGLDHWRPLAMPLVVLGLWHAALSGRRSLLAVGMASVGLLAPEGQGLLGAALLLGGAGLLETVSPVERRGGPTQPILVLASVLIAAGSLLAVAAGLRGEVAYTVLAAGSIVAALGRRSDAQASTASAPRATEPST